MPRKRSACVRFAARSPIGRVEVLLPMIASGRAAASMLLQHRALDLRPLQHGFLDQIRLGDRLRQAVGCAQVGPDQIGRPGVEEPLGLEVLGFATQPVEVATGQGGIGVDDDHVETGHRKDLGDTATHVAGADDGDVLDLIASQRARPSLAGRGCVESETRDGPDRTA